MKIGLLPLLEISPGPSMLLAGPANPQSRSRSTPIARIRLTESDAPPHLILGGTHVDSGHQ